MHAVFDIGNVILNWDVDAILASLPFSEDQKQRIKNELFFHPDWREFDAGLISQKQLATNTANRTGNSISEIDYSILVAQKSLSEIPETVQLITELKQAGKPVYGLSNMPIETWQIIRTKPVFSLFLDVVVSGYLKLSKPDPAIYQHLFKLHHLEPENLLFIDDLEENVATARDLGMTAVLFDRTSACYQTIRELCL